MKRILFLLLLLQVTLLASAYDIKVDGLCYNFTSDSTVAVTYVNFPNNDEYVKGDLVVPATIIYEGKKYAVTSIGKNAFYFCRFLKSVKLPTSIRTIEDYAFSKCSALESIEVPEGVNEVGAAFTPCAYLKSIVLPSSVAKIHLFFIWSSDRMEEIVCKATTPPTFVSGDIPDSSLSKIPKDYFFRQCTLRVPKESVEAYKNADGWKQFSKIEPYSPDEVSKPVEPKSTLPTPTLDPRAVEKDMSEFLKLSSYDPFKWTQDDHFIMQRALNRMTIRSENGMSSVKDMKSSDLNMSEELFNFIKKGFEAGNALMEEGKSKNGF